MMKKKFTFTKMQGLGNDFIVIDAINQRLEDIDYSRYEQVKQLLPDSMGVIGQYGDIFTLVWELMGFETFAFAFSRTTACAAASLAIGTLKGEQETYVNPSL